MQNEKEQYIKDNFKEPALYESKGGPRALSEFLDMLVADDEINTMQASANVGANIHREMIKTYEI